MTWLFDWSDLISFYDLVNSTERRSKQAWVPDSDDVHRSVFSASWTAVSFAGVYICDGWILTMLSLMPVYRWYGWSAAAQIQWIMPVSYCWCMRRFVVDACWCDRQQAYRNWYLRRWVDVDFVSFTLPFCALHLDCHLWLTCRTRAHGSLPLQLYLIDTFTYAASALAAGIVSALSFFYFLVMIELKYTNSHPLRDAAGFPCTVRVCIPTICPADVRCAWCGPGEYFTSGHGDIVGMPLPDMDFL